MKELNIISVANDPKSCYFREPEYDRIICGAAVEAFLGERPDKIQIEVKPYPFKGSKMFYFYPKWGIASASWFENRQEVELYNEFAYLFEITFSRINVIKLFIKITPCK